MKRLFIFLLIIQKSARFATVSRTYANFMLCYNFSGGNSGSMRVSLASVYTIRSVVAFASVVTDFILTSTSETTFNSEDETSKLFFRTSLRLRSIRKKYNVVWKISGIVSFGLLVL